MIKNILIPVAAFAVTVAGASAFTGGDMLEKLNINLTDTQVEAIEKAEQIREDAHTEAQQVLENAGIDKEKMQEIRGAMHEEREAHHEEVEKALEDNDYSAFTAAIADSPLADIITSEEAFTTFREAHALKEDGKHEEAREIMESLGFPAREGMHKGFGGPGFKGDRQSAESE